MNILMLFIFSLIACKTNQIEQETNMSKHIQTEETTYQLHDIWVLVNISDSTANLDTLPKGAPMLEIKVADKKFGGFSSCNNYGGELTDLDDMHIHFGNVMATKMFCLNAIETQYFNALNQVDTYKIEKLHLYLYDKEGNELMVFKKVD